MDAIILAAGRGTRLQPLTDLKPKCMVRVNGRSIIDYQIRALLDAGVDRVIVVIGYQAERLQQFLRARFGDDPRIVIVVNAEYDRTNNMFSLHLCADAVGSDGFLLLNGDVVFDASIIVDLLSVGGNAVCVDMGRYEAESMKVVTEGTKKMLRRIAKSIPPSEAAGCSIDVYRFDASGAAALLDEARRIIERDGQRDQWTEVALDRLMREGGLAVYPLDIRGRKWWEIDDLRDLQEAELLFGRDAIDWSQIEVAFLDMDGTLYRGDEPFEGVDRFVDELRRRVPWVYFLSNNSSKAHADYQRKLRQCGVEASAEDIVLSTDALIDVLEREGIDSVCLIGTAAMERMLNGRGIRTTDACPMAVVVGFDTELTYEKLRRACLLLQNAEVAYFASHPDRVCPTEAGDIPDAGSIVALIEAATGRRPQQVCGKPRREMVEHIFARHGIQGSQAVFVGDRVYTDYEMAVACGSQFVAVLSGEATRVELEECEQLIVVPRAADLFTSEAAVRHVETGTIDEFARKGQEG